MLLDHKNNPKKSCEQHFLRRKGEGSNELINSPISLLQSAPRFNTETLESGSKNSHCSLDSTGYVFLDKLFQIRTQQTAVHQPKPAPSLTRVLSHGYFCATAAGLSSCNRNHGATKPKIQGSPPPRAMFQAPSKCLRLQIKPSPIHSVLFPTHTYP